MKKNIFAACLVTWFVISVYGEDDPDVKLSGVMSIGNQRSAIVNGKVCHVGDEIAGGKVVFIDDDGIEFLRNNITNQIQIKQNFSKNTVIVDAPVERSTSDASEPSFLAKFKASFSAFVEKMKGMKFKKSKSSSGKSSGWLAKIKKKMNSFKTKKKRASVVAEKKSNTTSITSKENKDKQAVTRPKGGLTLPHKAGELSLDYKMRWADKILDDQDRRLGKLLNGPLKQCKTRSQLDNVHKQFENINHFAAVDLNELHLPCPCAKSDGAYRKWSRQHAARSKRVSDRHNNELKKVTKRLDLK